MAKTWIECFQEAKIIAGAGRQPCKSWVTGLWPDFENFSNKKVSIKDQGKLKP